MLSEIRKRYGATVVRVTKYNGSMRRHAGWRQEHSAFSHLDACAHARVTYSAPTVRRRRHNG